MSDSNRVEVNIRPETVWGEIDAGNPKYQTLALTGESLIQSVGTNESQILRADRQNPGLNRVSLEASGDLNFELLYDDNAFWDLLTGQFQNTASAVASNGPGSLTVTGGGVTFAMTGIAVGLVEGQWFRVAGSASNDGFHQIKTRTSDDSVDVEIAGSDEGPTATVTVDNDGMLRNGTTFKSWTVEKQMQDVAEFMAFRGMAPSSLGLNAVPGDFVTGSLSMLGRDVLPAGATVGDGAPTAAPTTQSMTGVSDVKGIVEGTGLSALDITNLSFTYDNNLAGRQAIGNLGSVSLRSGRIGVSGQLEAYFANRTLYEKFTNFTESNVSFRTEDAAGNAYIWTVHKLRYTEGAVVAGGIDQDVLVALGWTAYLHPTRGTIQVDKFAA